jgi:hypothetical protein
MRMITYYLHAPSDDKSQPQFVPISGDFEHVDDAWRIAIAAATNNPRFNAWCVGFEIENENGQIVSKWSLEDA